MLRISRLCCSISGLDYNETLIRRHRLAYEYCPKPTAFKPSLGLYVRRPQWENILSTRPRNREQAPYSSVLTNRSTRRVLPLLPNARRSPISASHQRTRGKDPRRDMHGSSGLDRARVAPAQTTPAKKPPPSWDGTAALIPNSLHLELAQSPRRALEQANEKELKIRSQLLRA